MTGPLLKGPASEEGVSAAAPGAIRLEALTSAAFEPFGAVLAPPPRVGERAMLHPWLTPVEGRTLQMHLNRVAPRQGTAQLTQLECHPHAAQMFVPVGVSRYVVVVAPGLDSGDPDVAGLRAFEVPGTVGIVYRPGAWHAGISVLDHEASFLVAMWRGGQDDDVFVDIPPIEVDHA